MKKSLVIITLAIVSVLALSAKTETAMWFWEHNDDAVQYFRYATSLEPEWRVVGNDHYSVIIESVDVDDYEFYLQQSYDGENWSESSTSSIVLKSDAASYKLKASYERVVTSLHLNLFESYMRPQPYLESYQRNTEYSFGADLGVAVYFSRNIGIAATVSGNVGWDFFQLNPFRYGYRTIYGGAYVSPAFRVLDKEYCALTLLPGIGTSFEFINGKFYLSPSVSVAIDGAVKFKNNISLSVKPSFTFSTGTWDESRDFRSYLVKSISVGVEWRAR